MSQWSVSSKNCLKIFVSNFKFVIQNHKSGLKHNEFKGHKGLCQQYKNHYGLYWPIFLLIKVVWIIFEDQSQRLLYVLNANSFTYLQIPFTCHYNPLFLCFLFHFWGPKTFFFKLLTLPMVFLFDWDLQIHLVESFLSPFYHLSTKPWPAKSFLVGP